MTKDAEKSTVNKLAAGFAQARPAVHSFKEARSKRLQGGNSLPSPYRTPGFILHVVYDGIKCPALGQVVFDRPIAAVDKILKSMLLGFIRKHGVGTPFLIENEWHPGARRYGLREKHDSSKESVHTIGFH